MLSHCRILDLTDDKGFICGRVLADLGADVIKIEPPSGDPSRRIGPYYHDDPDPEKSLYWFAYNSGKRGITLNLETSDGRELFKKLAATADFVIESFAPGYMESLGLGYSALRETRQRIILASITPFGQSGPYRDFKTSDLVSMSLGGYVYLTGDHDRPPVRIGFAQAYLHGGMAAVCGTMIAHYHRELTGEGQWVDVSIQEACALIPTDSYNFWEISGLIEERHGAIRLRPETGARMRRVWKCKDGYVNTELYGGGFAKAFTIPLVAWMDEEGMAPDYLKAIDWASFDYSTATREEVDRIVEAVGRFFLAHTKQELWEGGVNRRCVVYPVASPKEVVENAHLAARGYWVSIDHPELGESITYPGPCVRLSESGYGRPTRAPLIGEHNREVYSELGLSQKDLTVLKQAGAI
jgi:crotonobetainyl-CoA:carnitine CoA-transferase CaiB-like acyl-CoA transferase